MSKTDLIRKYIAAWLFEISLFLVPLYMNRGYSGLLGVKAVIYLVFAIPAVLFFLLVAAADFFIHLVSGQDRSGEDRYMRKSAANMHSPHANPAGTDKESAEINSSGQWVFPVLLTAIGLWAAFSSLCSSDIRASFLGAQGWYVGSLMILVLLINTWIMCRHLELRQWMIISVLAVNAGIFLLAVLQCAGLDPFGLLEPVFEKSRADYLSTIGNINCFSGYLCLMVPLFCGFYIFCEDRITRLIYGGICLLGFLCVILCNSDSVYAGFGLCLFFLLPAVFEREERLGRTGGLLLLFGGCLLAARLLPVFELRRSVMRDFSALMLSPFCAGGFAAIGAVCILISRKKSSLTADGRPVFSDADMRKALPGKILIILQGALGLLAMAAVIWTVLHMNDEWGSGRGLIWRTGLAYFRQLPLLKKLTGTGPEMLAEALAGTAGKLPLKVISAHSEPLQILISQGIIGTIGYLLFWISSIAVFIMKKMWRDGRSVFFLPLAAYLGQSLLCSAYPLTAVVFSVMAGLFWREALTGSEDE